MKGSALAALAGAGLFGAAAAWALNQQVAYIIASWACGPQAQTLWIVSLVAVAMVGLGAVLSWRVVKMLPGGAQPTPPEAARRFLALVSLMAVLLFLFAILLQAAAALFLPGCRG